MPTLLERQVNALRESIRPSGRWNRLASGEMKPGEDTGRCALCDLAPDDAPEDEDECAACPLAIAGQECWPNDDDAVSVYNRWDDAVDLAANSLGDPNRLRRHDIYNAPPVVALAREMKALLERLLGEYEARLAVERCEAAGDITMAATPPHLHATPEPDDDRACPHCGGKAGTWFDRAGAGVDVCEGCGKDVGKPPEHYARADALGEAYADLLAALEEMHDVGAETAPLVVEAYRAWRALRDA